MTLVLSRAQIDAITKGDRQATRTIELLLAAVNNGTGGLPPDGVYGDVTVSGSGTIWTVTSSGVADGDYGDITVSGGGTVFTIDASVVTNAKMADMPAFRFKANSTAGVAAPQDITALAATQMLQQMQPGISQGVVPASASVQGWVFTDASDFRPLSSLPGGGPGPPGSAGDDGEAGPPGPPGAAGVAGAAGAAGVAGVAGPPGWSGDDGDDGIPGPPGANGAAGAAGAAGVAGPPGWAGDDGDDGAPGPPGQAGVAGSAGAAGAAGANGPPGWAGEDGEDGSPGPPGANGVAGANGAAGVAGPPGWAGDDGATGDVGPPGIPGVAGAAGSAGVAGAPGPPGPPGDDGADGIQGPQGVPGPQAAGDSFLADVTLSGSPESFNVDLSVGVFWFEVDFNYVVVGGGGGVDGFTIANSTTATLTGNGASFAASGGGAGGGTVAIPLAADILVEVTGCFKIVGFINVTVAGSFGFKFTIAGAPTSATMLKGSGLIVIPQTSSSVAANPTPRLNELRDPNGSVEFAQQQALQFRIENRTSDPGAPAVGEIWLRTDL